MKFTETALPGVYIVEAQVFGDSRGFFMESWSSRSFEAAGLHYDFVQDNHSLSTVKGTVGGGVLDVAVDLRPSSPFYKKWVAVELTGENKRQLLIPRGFGHGFLTLTDEVEFLYKADNPYAPEADGGIRWNDPEIGVDWGIEAPILSEKDSKLPFLQDAVTGFEEW